MGSVNDVGTPGSPLSTPPLTEWQKAVRDALNSSDVTVDERIASSIAAIPPVVHPYPTQGTATVLAPSKAAPAAGQYYNLPILDNGGWGQEIGICTLGAWWPHVSGYYRITALYLATVAGDGAYATSSSITPLTGGVSSLFIQYIRTPANYIRFSVFDQNVGGTHAIYNGVIPDGWTNTIESVSGMFTVELLATT